MQQRDGVLIGTVAGMIATLAKDIPNLLLLRAGFVGYSYWSMAATTFVRPQEAYTPIALLVGAFVDLTVGGLSGLIIVLVLRALGKDLWFYKGIIAGQIVWFFGLGLGVNTFARMVSVDPLFRLIALGEHWLYGLVAVYIIIRWDGP